VIEDVLVAFVKTAEASLKLIFTKEPKKREIQQDTHTAFPYIDKKILFSLNILELIHANYKQKAKF